MDINSIYIILRSHQNDDNSVTCSWDFNEAGYEDKEGNVRNITLYDFMLDALHVPDPKNPLITQLPYEMRFEREGQTSKLYKAKWGRFTIGEILEAIRSFMEKIYNEKYSNDRYNFSELCFEGLTGMCGNFEIRMDITGGNINAFGGLQQFVDIMEGV